jgi:hypothetical protein
MKARIFFGFALFVLLLPVFVFAQEVKSRVWTDTNRILIGDHLVLHIQVEATPPTEVIFPEFKDSLGKFEIVRVNPLDTQKFDNKIQFNKKVVLIAFDTGNLVIPSLNILYLKKNTNQFASILTDSINIYVKGIEIDTTKDIKDIKGIIEIPYTFWDYLPYILIVIGIVAVAYLVYFFLKRRKKISGVEEPKVPPHIEALEALKKLDKEKLWQKGYVKDFHVQLTEIIRRYIERQFDIPALEMISEEILQSLEQKSIADSSLLTKLRRSFEISDLVKFAKFVPLPDENAFCLKTAFEFVESTMPKETETSEVEKDKGAE